MIEATASRVMRRVVVVDADPAFGRSLREDFDALAFEVETIATADEALASVAARVPALVVLDLYLADGAALKLLRLWRVQQPTLIVILVSGNASLGLVVDALKEGARGFFTKPVRAAALLDELEDRQSGQRDPPMTFDMTHLLSDAALKANGVDQFFAISPGLLSVTGFDGYFKMLNPAWEKTLGYSVQELCSQPYLELVHPDDRIKASDEALEIRHGQTVFSYKNRFRCKEGQYRWLAWSATPAPSQRLIYACARDVTNSVKMEQGLRESNQRLKRVVASRDRLLRESSDKNDTLVELGRFKDEVAATIVHDLKNPLSVIVANYDYILESFEGPADCLEALQDSQDAGRRMLRLLSNLVDVARLEDGTMELRSSRVNISEILQDVADQRRVMARARKSMIVMAPGDAVTADVDRDLLTRLVENLFDNALRYTPSGGVIDIQAHEVGTHVEIRIGNSGPPIPGWALASLFDKYRKISPEGKTMNLGLGLYFCRLAIEAHGGSIRVEETSRLPTVFVIRLPRVRVSKIPAALQEASFGS